MESKVKCIKRHINRHLEASRTVDLAIQILIIFSIISFSLETVPDLTANQKKAIFYTEIMLLSFFAVEYVLRILTSPKPLKYLTSFWGVIDTLAIVPYFLFAGFDIRYIRIIRLFRLLRILRIFRNNNTFKRIKRACIIAKEELLLFLGVALIILYISSVGIYYFEHEAQPEAFKSIPHSMWWSIATLTTVGYGDVYPVTVAGKIFTGVVVLMGLGFVAMPASILTSALSQSRDEESKQK